MLLFWGLDLELEAIILKTQTLMFALLQKMNDFIDKEIMGIAWDIDFENDIVISTITYDKYTLVKNINKYGLRI